MSIVKTFGIQQKCIIRTSESGVHYGLLVARTGGEVVLHNARRIWRWEGAFTLSAIANSGAGENSLLSEAVDEILLLGVIEVIPCKEAGIEWLDNKEAHSPA